MNDDINIYVLNFQHNVFDNQSCAVAFIFRKSWKNETDIKKFILPWKPFWLQRFYNTNFKSWPAHVYPNFSMLISSHSWKISKKHVHCIKVLYRLIICFVFRIYVRKKKPHEMKNLPPVTSRNITLVFNNLMEICKKFEGFVTFELLINYVIILHNEYIQRFTVCLYRCTFIEFHHNVFNTRSCAVAFIYGKSWKNEKGIIFLYYYPQNHFDY